MLGFSEVNLNQTEWLFSWHKFKVLVKRPFCAEESRGEDILERPK